MSRAAATRKGAKWVRDSIAFLFGEEARIVAERYAVEFDARLLVVDAPRGVEPRRILVSINEDAQLTQQSAMSLLRPDKLVFDYERLMALALAVVREPRTALQLGLGGGAMVRFATRYFPHTELTVVERDETVTGLARDFFHLTEPVVAADANEFVAETDRRFDVVLVDIYDSGGFAQVEKSFWDAAWRLVRPKGCLAVNWADPDKSESYRAHAARVAKLAEVSLFVTPRGFKDNIVQFASADPEFSQRRLRLASTALAKRQRRRDILERCAMLDRLP
jgi:spermidine synthase